MVSTGGVIMWTGKQDVNLWSGLTFLCLQTKKGGGGCYIFFCVCFATAEPQLVIVTRKWWRPVASKWPFSTLTLGF